MEKGRTTRLILEALTALSRGLDVVIVAHPAAEAFRIADEVARRAGEFGIPAALSEDNRGLERFGDAPLVMIRPFGWVPEAKCVGRGKPIVLVDHSARFDRPMAALPAVRTVLTT